MRILLTFFILMNSSSLLKAGQNTNFPYIAGGKEHSLMMEEGRLSGVGANDQGQLGLQDLEPGNNFEDIPGVFPVSLAVGENFSLVCDENGEVWVFGQNSEGQLGTGDNVEKLLQKNAFLKDIKYVTSSMTARTRSLYNQSTYVFSLALDKSGDVWFFGKTSLTNLYGIDGRIPKNISTDGSLKNIISIAAGLQFFIALDASGNVWLLEDGLEKEGERFFPGSEPIETKEELDKYFRLFKIEVPVKIMAIAAGREFALLLDENGRVWSFGKNWHGDLGLGNQEDVWVPTEVPGLENITQISAGLTHSLALNDEGIAFGFGANYNGQLGLGRNIEEQLEPIRIPLPDDIKAIGVVTSYEGSFVVDTDNNVWVMGENTSGQLGYAVQNENENDYYFYEPFDLGLDPAMVFPSKVSLVKSAKR